MGGPVEPLGDHRVHFLEGPNGVSNALGPDPLGDGLIERGDSLLRACYGRHPGRGEDDEFGPLVMRIVLERN